LPGAIQPPAQLKEVLEAIPGPKGQAGNKQSKRRQENLVLHSVKIHEESGHYAARLLVDESHPYFFDHPLDHVPGILIIEGLLQLFEVAIQDMTRRSTARGMFVREMYVMFTKWCEKNTPTMLRLEERNRFSEVGHPFVCKVEQNDEVIGTIHLKADHIGGESKKMRTPWPTAPEPCSNHAFLHKERPENVFVSDLKRVEDRYFVELIPPPPNHILTDGDPEFHSCLYLLEASRQCGLLITHALGGVPLELPMILLSARMMVTRPAYREDSLRVSYSPQTGSSFKLNIIQSMDLELSAAGQVLGKTTISALIVDKEEYRRQRWRIKT